METVQNNPESEMLKQVKAVKAEAQGKSSAVVSKKEDELPAGAALIESKAEVIAEAPAVEETTAAKVEEDLIRIGDQEFKTQAEAIKYAEKLERDRMYADAYNQGIQETIRATQPQVAPIPEEDKFDEEFYTDPKAAMRKVKEQASQEALNAVRAEVEREKQWTSFLADNPDIERKDAERVFVENMATLGKITDIEKGKKLLATLVRADYQRIRDLGKPRVELPNKGGQAVSAGSSTSGNVTPKKNDEKPLTLAQQMKSLRRQG